MSESLHPMQILQALSELEAEIKHLKEVLVQPSAVHYVKLSRKDAVNAKKALIYAVSELHFKGDGDSRSLVNEPGVAFVSPFVIDAIKRVNKAKSHFECEEILYRQQVRADESLSGNSSAKLRGVFIEAGYERLHVKQAVRKLVHIDYVPSSLTWFMETKGWGKQVTMFPSQAISRLERLGNNAHIQQQIEALTSLPSDEPLAQRRKEAPRIKVREYLHSDMRLHVGSLPLFIECDGPRATKDIELSFQLSGVGQKPKTHSRSKFEDKMFAPSINLYRYKEEHREQVREAQYAKG